MIPGINSVHGMEEWSSFRPTTDQGIQVEPPWHGDWSNRVYDDVLIPGKTYYCSVSDHGTIQGDYRVSIDSPAQFGLSFQLNGSVSIVVDNVYRFGSDNVWIIITVQQPVNVEDIFVHVIPIDSDPKQVWKPNFLEAMLPFNGCYRAMTLCGIDSRVAKTRHIEEFGGFARGPLHWNDTTAYGTYGSETGCNPRLWFPPGIARGWINMPCFIAASPPEMARWLYEAHRASDHVAEVFVALGNEVWANDTPIGQQLLAIGGAINHSDPSVGRCIAYLSLTRELQRTISIMGLTVKFKPVIEWQIGNRWPFMYDTYSKRWVSPECRSLASEIGRIAIAPYAGRYITELSQLTASVMEEMIEVDAWRMLCVELQIEPSNFHIYECSPLHFPRSAPLHWNRSPEALAAVKLFYSLLDNKMAEHSVVCHYGLCENDKWGALLNFDSLNDPLYAALAEAVA